MPVNINCGFSCETDRLSRKRREGWSPNAFGRARTHGDGVYRPCEKLVFLFEIFEGKWERGYLVGDESELSASYSCEVFRMTSVTSSDHLDGDRSVDRSPLETP